METMRQFSEKERANDLYKRRLDYRRVQRAFQQGLEDTQRKLAEAELEAEAARQREAATEREKERVILENESLTQEKENLRRQLLEAGIQPK